MNFRKHYNLELNEELVKRQNKINQLNKERESLKSEVEKYKKAFEDAKTERDNQICEYQKKIEKLENHHKFSMIQIDDVLLEFLGVTHEIMDNPTDFEKILQETIDKSKSVSDFLPTDPIKVADMLISIEGECEPLILEREEYKDTYKIFDVNDLKQIAQHLLIYCEHNAKENI